MHLHYIRRRLIFLYIFLEKKEAFLMQRLPKGMGSVYKLSGSRRRPYAARIQTGRTEDGKAIYNFIGYYATRQEALTALLEYNKNPYDLTAAEVTIADLWDIFKQRRFDVLSGSGHNIYNAAYKHLKPFWDTPIKDLKTFHLQNLIDNIDRSWQTKDHVKTLLNQFYDLACELDIMDKNYSKFVKIGPKPQSEKHKIFTPEEIKTLFSSVFVEDIADTVLMMIYSGMRPSELLTVRTENIHLAEKYIIGGLKTAAGKDRVIPISDKTMSLFVKRYNANNTYLIDMSYQVYRKQFNKLMQRLNMDHLPHDGRHTFISMADSAGVNKTIIKLIVGHASQDITERVYTHKLIGELIDAVNVV